MTIESVQKKENYYNKYEGSKPYEKQGANVEYKVKEGGTSQGGDFYKSYKHKDSPAEIKRSTVQSEKPESKAVEEKPKEEVVIQKKGRGEMKFSADGDNQLEQDKIMEGTSYADQEQSHKDYAPKKRYSDKADWKDGPKKYDKYDNSYKSNSKYYNSREDKGPKKDYYGGKPQGYKKKNYDNYGGSESRQFENYRGSKTTQSYQEKKTSTTTTTQQANPEAETKKSGSKNNLANPFVALNSDDDD